MFYTITNVYVLASFLAISGLLQGFDVSSIAGILSTKAFKDYYGNPDPNVTGGITATISGGSFLGCYIAFLVIDRLGRRATVQVACISFIIGAVISAASINVAMLIIGRLLSGIGVGKLNSSEAWMADVVTWDLRYPHFYRSGLCCRASTEGNKGPNHVATAVG